MQTQEVISRITQAVSSAAEATKTTQGQVGEWLGRAVAYIKNVAYPFALEAIANAVKSFYAAREALIQAPYPWNLVGVGITIASVGLIVASILSPSRPEKKVEV